MRVQAVFWFVGIGESKRLGPVRLDVVDLDLVRLDVVRLKFA
jgi:hypothetical protein